MSEAFSFRSLSAPYPSVFDPTSSIKNGLGFLGQPDTVLYDSTGRMVKVWPGQAASKKFRTERENGQLLNMKLGTTSPNRRPIWVSPLRPRPIAPEPAR